MPINIDMNIPHFNDTTADVDSDEIDHLMTQKEAIIHRRSHYMNLLQRFQKKGILLVRGKSLTRDFDVIPGFAMLKSITPPNSPTMMYYIADDHVRDRNDYVAILVKYFNARMREYELEKEIRTHQQRQGL